MSPLVFVTIASLALAAVMSIVAWRTLAEERRRSAARVAQLSAEVYGDSAPFSGSPSHDDLFRAPTATRDRRHLAGAIAAGVCVVGAAAALAILLSGGSRAAAVATQPAAAAAELPPASLELTALGHERDGDRLLVRGVVHNRSGSPIQGLTAVVFVFDRDGGFLTSGRAAVQPATPGGDSPFLVAIPGLGEVGRYRVSFRMEDRIVPHVDRRRRESPSELP